MFEPVSKQWHTQKVTGDHPQFSQSQCVVGLEGDNGTYEASIVFNASPELVLTPIFKIFMYGGLGFGSVLETTINLGAVWVLSLPAFHWERQPDPLRFGRWMHSCQIAPTGNRQMISVGGMVATNSIPSDELVDGTVDPWDQGIGVFDMSDFEWKSSYDASAGSYVTPSIIKEYYERNEQYPDWDDTVVEKWFVEQGS